MMRRPVASAGKALVSPTTVPAPVGGWNARDSLAAMRPTDAIVLDNLFPTATTVDLRAGSMSFASVPADTAIDSHQVRGLLGYYSPTGVKALFAAADDGLYDITAGGAVTTPVTPATNSQWNSVMVTTAGGSFLWCCNGVDKSRYYNGTAWTILDGASTPALTGITSTDIQDVLVFKARLLFVEKDSMSFWYLPVNSIAGVAVEYPCGELFDKGGKIASVAGWTVDNGEGSDDYLCVVSTEGEVAVFKGTDPASTANWALQGVYEVAKPIGIRCTFKFGGDLCLITNNGIVPMSTVLQSTTIDKTKNLSDRISQAFLAYSTTFGKLFGWQATVHSEAMALLINVPLGFNRSYQFVMNTLTKAWCRFTGLDAEVMTSFAGELYFARSNQIYKGLTGLSDNGNVINTACKTAFNPFKSVGSLKHASLLRPIFSASATLNVSIGIDADFEDNNLATSASTFVQNLSFWDTALWDSATWTSGSVTIAKWRSINHKPGRSLALRLRFSVKNVTVSWTATDFIIKPGGFM